MREALAVAGLTLAEDYMRATIVLVGLDRSLTYERLAQAALAIDSARLYAESAEKMRIDRDLRIAAEIQRALLPEPTYEASFAALAASSGSSRIDISDRPPRAKNRIPAMIRLTTRLVRKTVISLAGRPLSTMTELVMVP